MTPELKAEALALVKALGECGSLAKESGREACIQRLQNSDIGNAIRRSDNKNEHLQAIVFACLDFDGGIEDLMDAISFVEKDSYPMQVARQRADVLIQKRSKLRLSPPVNGGGDVTRANEFAYALLIGISRYQHGADVPQPPTAKQFVNLTAAAKDAEDLAAVLAEETHIGYEVHTLDNEQADRRSIMRALDNMRQRCAGKNDPLVLVYFSGHGACDPDGRHYIVPHDSERADLFSTAIWNKTFNNALDEIQTNRLVVLLDACHAEAMAPEASKAGAAGYYDPQINLGERAGRYLVASCGAGQLSREIEGNGIFTQELITLLACRSPDIADETIELWAMFTTLRDKVDQAAHRHFSRPQKPIARFDGPTGIILAINEAERQRRRRRRRQWFEAISREVDLMGFKKKASFRSALDDFLDGVAEEQRLRDFYDLFLEYALEDLPRDSIVVQGKAKSLINRYTKVVEWDRQQEGGDQYGLNVPVPLSTTERIGAARFTPAPAPKGGERRLLSEEDCAYIIEPIKARPDCIKDRKAWEMLMRQSEGITPGQFTHALDAREVGDDTELADLIAQVGTRFMERWKKAGAQQSILRLRAGTT